MSRSPACAETKPQGGHGQEALKSWLVRGWDESRACSYALTLVLTTSKRLELVLSSTSSPVLAILGWFATSVLRLSTAASTAVSSSNRPVRYVQSGTVSQ